MATKEQLERHKQFILEQRAKKDKAEIDRRDNVFTADYSGYSNIDEMLKGLTSQEARLLTGQNETFKKRLEDFDLIAAFKKLSDEDQAVFFAEANEATRITLENDGYVSSQTLTLAPSPDEAAAEKEAERIREEQLATMTLEEIEEQNRLAEVVRLQAEADRLAEEAAAAGTVPAVPRGSVEELYPGVEKLGNNAYKLSVDPEDGSPVEVYWGESQKECFQKLREAKKHATRELRRRKKKLEITDELRAIQPEVLNYAPLVEPLSLTPDEIFKLTEMQKDPITVLEATRKLRQASLTPDEIARLNETTLRQRYTDAKSVAQKWITQNPEFHPSPENIERLKTLMGTLDWAVTENNLDLAFKTLKDQGALDEAPKEQVQPVVSPAPVVPAAPVVTPVAPPQAPAGALPAAPKRILRPGSLAENSTGIQPTVRLGERTGRPPAALPMSAEEYAAIPAAQMRQRYAKDPEFKARVDAYWAAGGR